MARNKLSDLNNHLFEQLERLNDEELTEEQLTKEMSRAKAMTEVSKQIVDNAKLQLDAQKHADEFGYGVRNRKLPEALLTNEHE